MIFGSLFLLLVSAVLLAFGIGKSTPSLLLLVLALISAVMASLLLLAAYQAHKVRLALAGGGTGSGSGPGAAPNVAMPAFAGGAGGAVYYVPVAASGQPLMFAAPPSNGNIAEPLVGYDSMTSAQLGKLIGSGALTEDQKMAIVAYESAHQQRKTVIAALNAKAE